jgi:multidrug efflux pump subunit AcrA (membrane-fusion protein)
LSTNTPYSSSFSDFSAPADPFAAGHEVDQRALAESQLDVREIVQEIQTLCVSDAPLDEFYAGFLNRLVSALFAFGGALWMVNSDQNIELQYQTKLLETGLTETEEDQQRHAQVLRRVLLSGRPDAIAPRSGDSEGDQPLNPSEYLLLLCPLKSDQEVVGVVEIFQRAGARPTVERGWVRFVQSMAIHAGNYLKTRRLRQFSQRQTMWSQLENFTRSVHRGLHPRDIAYTVANEGRRLIECDRVSVALLKGNKATLSAVSGQDILDRRANSVRLLNRLTTAVVRTGEPLWYFGDTTDLAPQVENAVQEYVDTSHSKIVAVLPLREPESPEENQPPGKVIGALIVEQLEEARTEEWLKERTAVVCEHAGTALANAIEHHALFLMPLWRLIGRSRALVALRNLPKTLLAAGALIGAVLALCLIPAELEIESRGTLEPVAQREVFAAIDGVVQDVYVDQGLAVAAGAPLVEMKNTDLSVGLADVLGRLEATKEQIRSIDSARSDYKLSDSEKSRLAGQAAQLQALRKSLEQQVELAKQKLAQLKAISPIAGQVVTWQVRDRLVHRPVQRGQVLMTIADPTGPWQLELHVPEDRMGYVAGAKRDAEAKHSPEPLKVTYILATNPGQKRAGSVAEIHTTAEVRGDEGNTVLVRVTINKDDLTAAELRPGATVTAKIDCGQRALGYVWFHDVVNFVQSKILFKL